jgi:four helix bundle protein
MQDYTKLIVWQRARSLTVAVQEATRAIRSQAAPGLRSQLMRATMSISATIAEGAGRETRVDFARFVSMAIGSASEVEHHLSVCTDLGLVDTTVNTRLAARCVEIRRMLYGLRRALLSAAHDGQDSPPEGRLMTVQLTTHDSERGCPTTARRSVSLEQEY